MSKQKLYELKSKRADAIELAEKALNEGNRAEHDEQMKAVKDFNAQIEAYEELEAQKGMHQTPAAAPVAAPVAKKAEETGYEKAVKALGEAVRSNFAIKAVTQGSMMNTEHGIDGGYAVPEDIVARVFSLRDAEESLLSEVTVNTVTAKTGRRTMKKRSQHAGFATVAEAAKYPKLANPEFQTVEYAIEKRGGYLPATAEVYEYSDGDIARVVEEWMSAEARATANREILEQIGTKEQVNLTDMDGILKAWVGLGAAFRSTSKLITNDDGLAYLATLKGQDGAYLMSPNPTAPTQMQLAVGPYVLPVKVFDKLTMPSTGTKAPMVIGDLKAGIAYWQKKALAIKPSDVAVAGDLNAYEQDLILWRGSMWDDCTTWDTEAFVNGYIDTASV
jgi:HK97 family phage major capsid protein